MADPETQPETGTGEQEEVAQEATEETPAVDTPADDSADDEQDEPEVGTQDHEAKPETNVPYSRFKSVNERRKAAETENIELKAKLAALTPKEEAKPESPKARLKGLQPAPADMTPLEQMEFYGLQALEKHPEFLDKWFAAKFGMAPEQAAATLSYTTTSTQDTIRSQFEAACAERGLDSKSPAIRDAVGRMMDSNKYKNFGEAMDVFVKPRTNGTKPQQKPEQKRGPETGGVDVTGLQRSVKTILDKNEATAMAEKGVRVPQKSITEILGIN